MYWNKARPGEKDKKNVLGRYEKIYFSDLGKIWMLTGTKKTKNNKNDKDQENKEQVDEEVVI